MYLKVSNHTTEKNLIDMLTEHRVGWNEENVVNQENNFLILPEYTQQISLGCICAT